jgi:Cu(I)/Ag(I) efflux system membrane fusion protein
MGIARRQLLIGLGLGLGIGAGAAGGAFALFGAGRAHAVGAGAQARVRADAAGAPERYTCSMHPQILQDHPGSCPICNMALVKVAGVARAMPDGAAQGADMVHVEPAAQQRIGLQLATASVVEMARKVGAFATISADESATISVNSKVEGWLRRMPLQGVGQPVRRGQVLYEIYSPELQQRQREYIDLLTRKDGLLGDSMAIVSSNSSMIGSLSKEKFRARARLIAADMSEDLVDLLEKSRRVQDVVAVRAAHDGLVTVLAMHEGNFVNPMQQILAYADNRTVWAEVSLFPDQLEWVKNGDRMTLRSGLDARVSQQARVNLASVQIDPQSRGAKLRFALDNARGAFRPGAFAEVEIEAGRQRALAIPRDALIRTGHGDFVVVAEADNHFRRARVTAGVDNGDLVAIGAGLKAGERVAANGQFLLDGAASMQALQARLASGAR